MLANNTHGRSEQVPAGGPDRLPARIESRDAGAPICPWSFRIAGTRSSWPAIEVYEAGTLLDVVSSTRLVASVLRGGRALRAGGSARAFAWGRLPLDGDLPAVIFSRGRIRAVRLRVTPVLVTGWCWMATAEGRYDAVTLCSAGTVVRHRLQVGRPCR